MSDLDHSRISEVVDSLEKAFDEDNSGTVGMYNDDDFFSFLKNLKK